MAKDRLLIGSRGSKLALWQANYIREKIKGRYQSLEVEVKIIKTLGDRVRDVALTHVAGKGIFTKELEEAILSGIVNLAVHSLKDLPTELPGGLAASVVTDRPFPGDCLVSKRGISLRDLPAGSRVGTSSLRRQAQILALRSDLAVTGLRGNVDTRLAKLDRGECEAIVLARAGLERLGLGARVTELLPPEIMTPAAGQGALALEYREDDQRTLDLIGFLDNKRTALEVEAEREFLHTLGGGCQVPIGALAVLTDNGCLRLCGMISDLAGRHLLREWIVDHPQNRPGRALAEKMLSAGGKKIMEEIIRGS